MRTLGILILGLAAAGCEESDCKSGCPTLGEEAANGDVRLLAQTDTAFGILEIDDAAFDIALLGGELVLRPEPRCVASQDHPCRAEIRRLEIRPSGFTTSDRRSISEITLAVQTPFEVTDQGLGLVIDAGAPVHSCLAVEGDSRQHGVAPSESATIINYDERGLAGFDGTWPIVFSDVGRECLERKARLRIVSAFAQR